jgi:hypothetical protein
MLIKTRNGLIGNDISDAQWNVDARIEEKKDKELSEAGVVEVARLTGVTQFDIQRVIPCVDERIQRVCITDKNGKSSSCHLEGFHYFVSPLLAH